MSSRSRYPCNAGLTTGTAAAAVGGITTVIDMPLNSDPVTTVANRLREKQELANVGGKQLVNGTCCLRPDKHNSA